MMFFSQKILPVFLWEKYKNIPTLYRQTFWVTFIILNIVFGFHTVHFIFGNHDWEGIFERESLFREATLGRYTQLLISLGMQDGRIMPILNNEMAFFGLSLSSVLFCYFLNIEKIRWKWIIISFLLTLQPFVYGRMYYIHQVSGIFVTQAILFFGFVLAQKAIDYQRIKAYLFCFLSILCIHWTIAAYPPMLSTILTVFIAYIMILVLANHSFRIVFYKTRFLIIAILIGVLSFKLTYDILIKMQIVFFNYNNQILEYSAMSERVLLAFKTAIYYLFYYETAFMPRQISLLFLLFVIALLGLLLLASIPFKNKIFFLVLFVFLLLTSQTHTILSKNIVSYSSLEYHGLAFFRVLSVVLLLQIISYLKFGKILIQNGIFLLSCAVLWLCVVYDFHAQRAQKFAMDAEFRRFNRIIDRLEQIPSFSYDKQYCGILFGDLRNMRVRFHKGGALKNLPNYNDAPLVGHGLLTYWGPIHTFNFLMEKDIFRDCYFYTDFGWTTEEVVNLAMSEKKYGDIVKRLHNAGILEKLEAWPGKNSVVVFENIIVFVASEGNLKLVQNYAQKHWGNNKK